MVYGIIPTAAAKIISSIFMVPLVVKTRTNRAVESVINGAKLEPEIAIELKKFLTDYRTFVQNKDNESKSLPADLVKKLEDIAKKSSLSKEQIRFLGDLEEIIMWKMKEGGNFLVSDKRRETIKK